jgi:phosphoribosylformylglycinamidine synthase
MHAVAEAARKVACTGATPVAATNCLNFGNPEKPEIMAQLSAAIDGIAEACNALGTPITGGNVSLYNETRGEGIYPTPVLGIVGILDDVTKAVPAHFQREKDAIVLLWPIPRGEEPNPGLKVPLNPPPISQYPLPALEREPRASEQADASDAEAAANLTAFGSSEFAKVAFGSLWGTPPALDLDAEASLHDLLAILAWRKLIRSARDISDGGISVALAQAAFTKGIGATVEQDPSLLAHPLLASSPSPPPPSSSPLIRKTFLRSTPSQANTISSRRASAQPAATASKSPSTVNPSSPRHSATFAPSGPPPWKQISTARSTYEPVALPGSLR